MPSSQDGCAQRAGPSHFPWRRRRHEGPGPCRRRIEASLIGDDAEVTAAARVPSADRLVLGTVLDKLTYAESLAPVADRPPVRLRAGDICDPSLLALVVPGHDIGLDVRITRCCINYGPYQFPEKVIPLFVTNLLDGLPIPLYGDGRNVRGWGRGGPGGRAPRRVAPRWRGTCRYGGRHFPDRPADDERCRRARRDSASQLGSTIQNRSTARE